MMQLQLGNGPPSLPLLVLRLVETDANGGDQRQVDTDSHRDKVLGASASAVRA